MAVTDKTVMITGASRGIGAATARVFARAGANVILAARDVEKLADLAHELGPQAQAVPCDVRHYDQVATVVDAALDRFGRLDVLIGNAGVIQPISVLESADTDTWGQLVDINLKGVFHGMRAAIPVMKRQGGGTIITIGSGAAHNPLEGWSAYCASKAGAAMLTQCAHREAGQSGLRIMGLSPGTVATDMQHEIRASGINPVSQLDWSDHIPPDWPARALLWMCGPDAADLAGQEISLRDPAIRARIGLS